MLGTFYSWPGSAKVHQLSFPAHQTCPFFCNIPIVLDANVIGEWVLIIVQRVLCFRFPCSKYGPGELNRNMHTEIHGNIPIFLSS